MKVIKGLTPSMEDYLEAILEIETKNRVARVKDIAELLDVQMPSVTGAIRQLQEKEYINHEKNSFITLTATGMKAAEAVKWRHGILESFFTKLLGIETEDAGVQACVMEHGISQTTVRRLERLLRFYETEIEAKHPELAAKLKRFIES